MMSLACQHYIIDWRDRKITHLICREDPPGFLPRETTLEYTHTNTNTQPVTLGGGLEVFVTSNTQETCYMSPVLYCIVCWRKRQLYIHITAYMHIPLAAYS